MTSPTRAARVPLRPEPARPASWWHEASGAVADLGVLIPIAIALIVANGLSTTAVLLPAGALYLVVARTYRAPVAVQPLKAFGAVAIGVGAGTDVIAAGSALMGLVFLALGTTGVLDRLARWFPHAVIRGVQLAVGLTFLRIAWGLVGHPPATFTHQWPAPVTAAACVLITAALLRWRRSSALLAVLIGLALAAVATWRGGDGALALGPTPIVVPTISMADLVLAATLLVLPQIPLTLTNSCLAPSDAARRYFPDQAARITPSRLARTLGGANLIVAAIGGMPMCHGAGGMSAHHAFGARTWRAPALIGTTLIVLALLLGHDLAAVLRSFPLAVLAALLAVAGITHIRLLSDVRRALDRSLALAVGLLGATGHLLPAVLGGLAVALLAGLAARRGSPRYPAR